MHYYQFNIGDYAKIQKGLSLMEDLAYRRLLDLYYDTEAPIPDDLERVCRLIGMRDESEAVSYILSEFFLKSDGFYKNSRCDKDISKYKAKAARAKSANQARWEAKNSESDLKSDVKSDADQIPTNNQEPITNNHKKESRAFAPPSVEDVSAYCKDRGNSVDPDRFVDFYVSKNWMVGKTKMKDWKASVRTWEKRDAERKQSNQSSGWTIDHDSTDWLTGSNGQGDGCTGESDISGASGDMHRLEKPH